MSPFCPKIFTGMCGIDITAAMECLGTIRSLDPLTNELNAVADVFPFSDHQKLGRCFEAAHEEFERIIAGDHPRSPNALKIVDQKIVPTLRQLSNDSWQRMSRRYNDLQREDVAFKPRKPPVVFPTKGHSEKNEKIEPVDGPQVLLKGCNGKLLKDFRGIAFDLVMRVGRSMAAGMGETVPGLAASGLPDADLIEIVINQIHPKDETGLRVRWKKGEIGRPKIEVDVRADCLSFQGGKSLPVLFAICRSCYKSCDVFIPAYDLSRGAPGSLQYDPDYRVLRRKFHAKYDSVVAAQRAVRIGGYSVEKAVNCMLLPENLKNKILTIIPNLNISYSLVETDNDSPRVSIQFQRGIKELKDEDPRSRDKLQVQLTISEKLSEHDYPEDFYLSCLLYACALWIVKGGPETIEETPLWNKLSWNPKKEQSVISPVKSFGPNDLPDLKWFRALRTKIEFDVFTRNSPDPEWFGGLSPQAHFESYMRKISGEQQMVQEIDQTFPGMAELAALQGRATLKDMFDSVKHPIRQIDFYSAKGQPVQIPTISLNDRFTDEWIAMILGTPDVGNLINSFEFVELVMWNINSRFYPLNPKMILDKPFSFSQAIYSPSVAIAWAWIRLFHEYEEVYKSSPQGNKFQIKIAQSKNEPSLPWVSSLKKAMIGMQQKDMGDPPYVWFIDRARHVKIVKGSEHTTNRDSVSAVARRAYVLVGSRARLICFDGEPSFKQESWDKLAKALCKLPQGLSMIEIEPFFQITGGAELDIDEPRDELEINPFYKKADRKGRLEYRAALAFMNTEARQAKLPLLTPRSTGDDVKKLFKKLSEKLHPDKLPPEERKSGGEYFREFHEAYKVVQQFHPIDS